MRVHTCVCVYVSACPGEKHGKSLLDKDAPTIWYQAAAALPALSTSASDANGAVTDADVDRLREEAETLLQQEAAAFDKEMSRRNPADYKWYVPCALLQPSIYFTESVYHAEHLACIADTLS